MARGKRQVLLLQYHPSFLICILYERCMRVPLYAGHLIKNYYKVNIIMVCCADLSWQTQISEPVKLFSKPTNTKKVNDLHCTLFVFSLQYLEHLVPLAGLIKREIGQNYILWSEKICGYKTYPKYRKDAHWTILFSLKKFCSQWKIW